MARRWMGLLLAGCAVAVAASSPSSPQQQPLDSNDTAWQRYVRAPPRKSVAPARVLAEHTTGNATNTGGLLGDAGSGPTVLTRLNASDDVPTLVVDFGQNVVGQLSIEFEAAHNTSEGYPGLTLAFSETLQFLTDRSDFTRSDNAGGAEKLTAGTDQIAVKPGPYTWTNQLGCEYGTQVCSDGLHGFRYLKIRLNALAADSPHTSAYGSVSIASVSLQLSAYLGTTNTFTGHFECSDTDLTQWWYDAVYTNDLCTDVFAANDTEPRNAGSPSLLGKLVLHDGAKRDRDPYVGDLAVSALTTYLSHDASEAARNVLEDLALHQRADGWIPPASINNYTLPLFDYPLWWVVSSADYVMYTGNMSYLTAYYPALVRVLDGYYVSNTNTATSLIERPNGAGDFAFIPRTGPVTYYNALYVHALKYAATLADALGKDDDASRWRARAAVVGPALLARNFDSSTGAFFDGGSCAGAAICPTHAQDGNSLAILSGVVPSGLSANTSLAESILSYMNQSMARPYGNAFYDNSLVSPGGDFANRVYAFISYFEMAARFETSMNASQGALEQMRRLYGWMATHDPGVTFWEGIGANGSPYEGGFTSMAHGWSTGIVPLLVNYVLGVVPTAPGFREWRVRPIIHTTDLTWASGLVPTPDGGISIQWQKAQNGFTLLVDTPENSKGTVVLPLVSGASNTVSVDGAVVYDEADKQTTGDEQSSRGYVTMSLLGGRHVIVVG
ncbi:alpha-l-rhamnosidase [Niveomyces insectorum RCEF 264]|uniref:Alpha-l-rhamnosidase n=1 Tax=Niveomyces insectorum RCEF 264 TaxID=1081102 RepID=A0A167TE59_9HYPO|nr:alpha-l-rhamnosidase [Niveomyces insectorum RCEF 264]